jgi:hypothetical protein
MEDSIVENLTRCQSGSLQTKALKRNDARVNLGTWTGSQIQGMAGGLNILGS